MPQKRPLWPGSTETPRCLRRSVGRSVTCLPLSRPRFDCSPCWARIPRAHSGQGSWHGVCRAWSFANCRLRWRIPASPFGWHTTLTSERVTKPDVLVRARAQHVALLGRGCRVRPREGAARCSGRCSSERLDAPAAAGRPSGRLSDQLVLVELEQVMRGGDQAPFGPDRGAASSVELAQAAVVPSVAEQALDQVLALG